MPRAWHQQLHEGGALVVPLFFGPSAYTQMVVAFTRTPTGFVSTNLTSAGFMALQGASAQPHATPELRINNPNAGGWKRLLRWDGLADLDEPAGRSLRNLLDGSPRQLRVEIPDPYSFALYATLTAPELGVASLTEAGAGSAVTFVDTDQHSIAALAYP